LGFVAVRGPFAEMTREASKAGLATSTRESSWSSKAVRCSITRAGPCARVRSVPAAKLAWGVSRLSRARLPASALSVLWRRANCAARCGSTAWPGQPQLSSSAQRFCQQAPLASIRTAWGLPCAWQKQASALRI
jgi:hypothetical protein